MYKIEGRYLTATYHGKNGDFKSTVAYQNGSDPRPLAEMAYASAKQAHDAKVKQD
jgi:hypothetical protein